MASPAPAKSQPLHNFNLPLLKWNNDGSSGVQNQRRRSMKSPSPRPNSSATSPVSQSPLRDSAMGTPAHHQSPKRDSPRPQLSPESPVHVDSSVKQSSIRGESSRPSPVRERVKQSPIVGDSLKQKAARFDSANHLPRDDAASETETSGKREGPLIEYRRNHHSKNSAAGSSKNGGNLKNSVPKSGEKIKKKHKATEPNASSSKKSKILIKISCKNNKPEEETPVEEPPKTDKNVDGETDEMRQEAAILRILEEDSKTWNLRPRKPIRKSLNVSGGAMKPNGGGATKTNSGAVKTSGSGSGGGGATKSAAPEKNKGPSSSKNVKNKAAETGANGGGGGGSEKEKKKLSIFVSLTKEEIEEDIYSMTGSKPSRKPKKRPKNVQKQLDYVFPGLWLQGITPESYKVSESSLKG